MKFFLWVFLILEMSLLAAAQPGGAEILTNDDVVLMTKAGLNKTLIIRKVRESKNEFDVSVQSLVALKNAGVDEEIINAIMDSNSVINKKSAPPVPGIQLPSRFAPQPESHSVKSIVSARDALRAARTVALSKSSLNPSLQALEKELFKRKEWQALNLNIVRYKETADLRVEIGFVHLSLITHRYVFRVYDNRSGTVITAGETTSWGSLSGNMAREISRKLTRVLQDGK